MQLCRLGLLVAVALAATACPKNRAKSTNAKENAVPALSFRNSGAAHAGRIDQVSLSVDGTIAMSRDTTGGLRLWPKLDGSKEPIAVPARGAQHFSAARAGSNVYTVATVEASGQAVITRIADNAEPKQLVALPPFDPVIEAHVLSGGEQVLTLHRDASIRLLRTNGRELGRYTRRKFSPIGLLLSADGKKIVAIEKGPSASRQNAAPSAQTHEIRVHPIDLTSNPQRMFVDGEPVRVRTPFAPSSNTLALSPGGRMLVTLTPNRGGRALLVLAFDLADRGRRRSFPTDLPVSSSPTVGFVGPETIAVSSSDGGGDAIQLNLRTGRTVPRRPPPGNVSTLSTGQGVQLGAFGSWLFVQDLARSTQRYLGYETFHPSAVAFSPSEEWIAWGTTRSQIFVEPFGGSGGEPQTIESDVALTVDQLFFVSEDLLLASFSGHRLALVKWREDQMVDETSVDFRSRASIDYEPDTHLLLINAGREGKRIVEIDPSGAFGGQHVLPDEASEAGLLSRQAGKDRVLWTANRNDSKLRQYSLAELRGGVSPQEVEKRGALMPPGDLFHIDRQGGRYVYEAGRVTVMSGGSTGTVEMRSPEMLPSWDSQHLFAVVSDGSRDLRLVNYETSTMEAKWTQRLPVHITDFAWSPSDDYVAVASESGGLVVDARTGKTVGARCGLSFEARGAPPPRDAPTNAPNLCDGL